MNIVPGGLLEELLGALEESGFDFQEVARKRKISVPQLNRVIAFLSGDQEPEELAEFLLDKLASVSQQLRGQLENRKLEITELTLANQALRIAAGGTSKGRRPKGDGKTAAVTKRPAKKIASPAVKKVKATKKKTKRERGVVNAKFVQKWERMGDGSILCARGLKNFVALMREGRRELEVVPEGSSRFIKGAHAHRLSALREILAAPDTADYDDLQARLLGVHKSIKFLARKGSV